MNAREAHRLSLASQDRQLREDQNRAERDLVNAKQRCLKLISEACRTGGFCITFTVFDNPHLNRLVEAWLQLEQYQVRYTERNGQRLFVISWPEPKEPE